MSAATQTPAWTTDTWVRAEMNLLFDTLEKNLRATRAWGYKAAWIEAAAEKAAELEARARRG